MTADSPLSLLDVPYLSQSEALCGGAAAAMVLRYWGAAGVTAEEFAPLVDRSRGGIETSALERAVEERGYEARAASGTAPLAQRELANGRPIVALIEDRPGAFHYVVVVGWHARAVVLHDPARTPFVVMQPAEFERRWRASDNWMLAVAPSATAPVARPAETPRSNPAGPPPRIAELGDISCEALVSSGVGAAQRNELAAAERGLAHAAYRCPGAAAWRELAGVRLLQRRWSEVRELAARAVEIDAADAHAWRLLATARYIGGDQAAALDAWNRAGEPVVDLVSVSGLRRTSHRAVERLLDIQPGTMLTHEASGRAARRLEELPAALMGRLEYVPRAAGAAEVRAHVVERSVLPRGALTWAGVALQAAASREVELPVASLGRGGERLDASWRFWPHRPGAAVALHVPGRFGLLSLEVAAERQRFDDIAYADAERLHTQARLADWAAAAFRWELRGGFARWQDAREFGTAGTSARLVRGRASIDAAVDAWLGRDAFAAGSLKARWQSSAARRGFVLDLSGAVETIGRDAPLDIWPAGDTGHARDTLLRAHPVLDDGRLRLDRLGRHLAQATAEAQHWWRLFAAVPAGAALFVDAARTSGRPTGPAHTDVDAGAGFRLALPGRAGLLRADLSHGLMDGRNAVSVAWTSAR